MRDIWPAFVKFFVSLRLTVVLLALSIVLIFTATLDQVNIGVWGVHEKYFHAFYVFPTWNGHPVFLFPGGYLIGGLLLLNLLAAHFYRFQLTWKKLGIQLTHAGVILLLIGELLSGLWQEDYQMSIDTGATKNYAESYRQYELAVLETSDPAVDHVVAIPAELLTGDGAIDTQGRLPFAIRLRGYWSNADLQKRADGAPAPASPATVGIGPKIAVVPLPPTTKDNDRNLPAAYVELTGKEGSLGVWLVSPMLGAPQSFDYAGKTWRLSLRLKRAYYDFSLTLKKFSHDLYPGTDIPKNYSSLVQLKTNDSAVDRDKLIYMNNPLRYQGLTFYQSSFANNDQTTILQVVRNPSWTMPYISCILVAAGLLFQFTLSLASFATKRSASAKPAASS